MNVSADKRPYDLEERTLLFARRVRDLVKRLPRTLGNVEDGKQVIRSSGSVGANYIEANEALGEKDFALRVKIVRKEAKESRYWLPLIDSCGKPIWSASGTNWSRRHSNCNAS